MKKILLGLVVLLSVFVFIMKKEAPSVETLYSSTTLNREDYVQIQKYLQEGKRPFLEYLKDGEPSARKLKLVGKRPSGMPQFGTVAVIGPFFNQTAAKALDVTLEESFAIPSVNDIINLIY